jgi:hypothetical protein
MKRTRSLVACALIAWVATGCLIYAGDRLPERVGDAATAAALPPPPIEVVLRHKHTMEGRDQGLATDLSYGQIKKSFERVRQEIAFLAQASTGLSAPDFVLELDTEVAERGETSAMISGFTLLLVPGFAGSTLKVAATLRDIDGNLVGRHEASAEVRMITQLLLLPLLPIVPFVAPGDELYDDTFRGALIPLAEDLRARQGTAP